MKIFFTMRKSMLRKEKFTKIFFIYRTYEQFLICDKVILEKKNPTHTHLIFQNFLSSLDYW